MTSDYLGPGHWNLCGSSFQRPFGGSELAFYPASRDGVGDMFLHLAFFAPKESMGPSRVNVAWAVIRARHPLLMSKVILDGEDPVVPLFSFTPPATVQEALAEARSALHFKEKTKDELIFEYMNGSRVLSDDYLSYLVISSSKVDEKDRHQHFDLLMCAPHFTGDGSSLHQSTHDLLSLLASPLSEEELTSQLASLSDWKTQLPPAFETRLVAPENSIKEAASKVNFLQTLRKEIGGHVLPRVQHGSQKTVLYEYSFTREETAQILAGCKAHGVTINHAMFALCDIAWARCISDPQLFKDPVMMYTAINLRPHLASHIASTYWFLSLTYFNVVLPSFLPADARVFWNRVKSAKAQTRRTIQSQFLVSRSLHMANIRVSRAQGNPIPVEPDVVITPPVSLPPAPSKALLGLSLIGNLDATYVRSAYPSFQLETVTTASRQKPSSLLLLEHTFGGQLWFHLCYDENGFEKGLIERFWQELQCAAREYML
ncbi:hypothetical protein BDQ17DRAFT_1233401 [Cyathus striatus]|nr:hypothetical protein BDQ17DRAFT_1233401 [Cyathus striatus]